MKQDYVRYSCKTCQVWIEMLATARVTGAGCPCTAGPGRPRPGAGLKLEEGK